MMFNGLGEFIEITFKLMAAMILVLLLTVLYIAITPPFSKTSRMLTTCEADLPRNQHCELVAVVKDTQ